MACRVQTAVMEKPGTTLVVHCMAAAAWPCDFHLWWRRREEAAVKKTIWGFGEIPLQGRHRKERVKRTEGEERVKKRLELDRGSGIPTMLIRGITPLRATRCSSSDLLMGPPGKPLT